VEKSGYLSGEMVVYAIITNLIPEKQKREKSGNFGIVMTKYNM